MFKYVNKIRRITYYNFIFIKNIIVVLNILNHLINQ